MVECSVQGQLNMSREAYLLCKSEVFVNFSWRFEMDYLFFIIFLSSPSAKVFYLLSLSACYHIVASAKHLEHRGHLKTHLTYCAT